MKYDVVIVGAGPAGIFTAIEMLRHGSKKKIFMVEKGQAVENRHCPKDKTKKCVNCKPYCHITTGFSGAGAFSDGKLSLSYEVGGDLPSLIGADLAQDTIDYTDKIYLEFGADTHIEGLENTDEVTKAFHGRTSLAVEATDNPKIVAPVNANGHVQFLPLNDLEAFQSELAKGDVAAVIIECIQGVGGIRLATSEFMQGLRKACSENGTVLICDEIQCGYGRSGKFFAHQHTGVRPDIITCAKGIGNGFPMGAVLISPQFEAVFGQLGTTFGGNHLACTAALAVLDVIEEEHLVENAASVGSYLLAQLKTLAAETPSIVDVRGEGLMIGIEFSDSIKTLRTRLVKEQHVFTGAASTNILRLLPPLCLTKAEADDFLSRLKQVL